MPKLKAAPETIAEYSDALRQRLAGTLPPEKIDEVVAETQAHLEDSAADLRYQADIYERQAISQFVPVGTLSQGISRAWAPTFLRHSGTRPLQLVSCLLACLGTLAGLAALTWRGYANPLTLAAVLVLPLSFLLAALACRPQPRRFIPGGVAAILLCSVWGGWKLTLLYPKPIVAFDPSWLVSRFDAPAQAQQARLESVRTAKRVAFLHLGLKFIGNAVTDHEVKNSLASYRKTVWGAGGIPISKAIFNAESAWYGRLRRDPQLKLTRELVNNATTTSFSLIARFLPAGLKAERSILVPREDGRGYDREPFPIAARAYWHERGPQDLEFTVGARIIAQDELAKLERLMAAPRERFEAQAARQVGVLAAGYVGSLVLADLLGGYLGMALLRLSRRRRTRRVGLGA
ncbi:hypothetical protein [Armatimonas rosea]|uniref:Uncharacterized protein n=1 Tax=Armatimonas rosea TaxID=685828 RepID=A0A7W9SQ98_ARMRO|nr:hypothetical protein [Armatimonas rosea]MBB6050213.1 hypothetical protein [Armatimonas rosea]